MPAPSAGARACGAGASACLHALALPSRATTAQRGAAASGAVAHLSMWEGRTIRNEIVHVDGKSANGRSLVGEVIEVDIEQAFKHSLSGTPTDAALATLPTMDAVRRPARRRRALPLVV